MRRREARSTLRVPLICPSVGPATRTTCPDWWRAVAGSFGRKPDASDVPRALGSLSDLIGSI